LIFREADSAMKHYFGAGVGVGQQASCAILPQARP
jgi:hypothetical protein